ncbi:hypothetical protein ACUODJ_43780, partial [Escherichia sp. HC-CC]
ERRRRDILLEEVLRQAGIPLLRSHDARKLLQMNGCNLIGKSLAV